MPTVRQISSSRGRNFHRQPPTDVEQVQGHCHACSEDHVAPQQPAAACDRVPPAFSAACSGCPGTRGLWETEGTKSSPPLA